MRSIRASCIFFAVVAAGVPLFSQVPPPQPPGPSPNSQYRLGPDSMPQEGVPKGEIRGPFTLPSKVYPGTQHTYWVYVPTQYDPAVPASLMIFNDGQAFKDPDGDVRTQNVLDNLIYRREIPVMLAVFINPGRTPEQPEPNAQEWGDHTTNRPTEYNTPDDKYARCHHRGADAGALRRYNISHDPDQHGIGGTSSGAIAAFMVAWERPEQFRKVLSIVGQFCEFAGRRCVSRTRSGELYKAHSHFHVRRAQRQSRGSKRESLRSKDGLVLPECSAHEGADSERLRGELFLGHEPARAEDGWRDFAGHDAVVMARRPGFDRSQ